MAQSKKMARVSGYNDVAVLHLGEMEIWDGADLALLRDSLTRIVRKDRRRLVGVDMQYVKYIPSGFFGMLFDWWDQGVRIFLFNPQPNVQRMLWFSRFFQPQGAGCHELSPDDAPVMVDDGAGIDIDLDNDAEAADELAFIP